LVPANVELSQAELDLVGASNRELVLRKMLKPVLGYYDFILVDCLPSLGLLTINALSAADKVLIPVQADFLAMKGLILLLETIVQVRDKINHNLEISGILFTMANIRTLHSREVIEMTKRICGDRIRVFNIIVPTSVRFKEAPVAGQSILTYASSSEGADAYRKLAGEVLK
jgi:chromosome partitioning protein